MNTGNFHRKYCLRTWRNLQWVLPLEKNKLSLISLVENSFSLKGNYLPTYLCIWHFINVTLVSLKFINENRKISRKPVWRHSRTVLGIILLKKNQNFIDYFRRKVIFFDISNLHLSTYSTYFHLQFQFIWFWTNQFQIWKHQWIP